jgi:Transposase and inactivated derivatives
VVNATMNGLEELRKLIEEGYVDLLRTMVKQMVEALMGAEVDALCGAAHGERAPERVNRRNGYRERLWDTRAGMIDLALPKLREGSYYPDWLLASRKRSEQALVALIADAYPAGVSTRRVDKLVRTLGIEGISKSSVSRLASSLDENVEAFRNRPLEGRRPRNRARRRTRSPPPRGPGPTRSKKHWTRLLRRTRRRIDIPLPFC